MARDPTQEEMEANVQPGAIPDEIRQHLFEDLETARDALLELGHEQLAETIAIFSRVVEIPGPKAEAEKERRKRTVAEVAISEAATLKRKVRWYETNIRDIAQVCARSQDDPVLVSLAEVLTGLLDQKRQDGGVTVQVNFHRGEEGAASAIAVEIGRILARTENVEPPPPVPPMRQTYNPDLLERGLRENFFRDQGRLFPSVLFTDAIGADEDGPG